MKKRTSKKKQKRTSLSLRVYGIFDTRKKKMLMVSLNDEDVQMELALIGGDKEHLMECDFEVNLSI